VNTAAKSSGRSQISPGLTVNVDSIKRVRSLLNIDLMEAVEGKLIERLISTRPGDSSLATSMVHDAYIRLVDVEKAQHWDSRGHIFGAAAEAMRRILVDQARHEQTQSQGGDYERIELSNAELAKH
jgi:hypothetical protein